MQISIKYTYVLNIYGDLHSLMFSHIIIYKTHLFSKYLRPFWDIKENKATPTEGTLSHGEVKHRNE